MKALGGGREKMDALGLQCAEKATMIVLLSWLADVVVVVEEEVVVVAEKRSGKAARVMQETAVSWEARERKVSLPLPLPPAVLEAFLFVGRRLETTRDPGQKQS